MRELKNTGVVWCPIIPKSWNMSKVKNCFYISKVAAGEKNPTVLKLARAGVQIRDVSNNEGQLAESYENYNPVRYGDLLLNPMDLYSGANCNMSEVEGVISPAYANLRALVELNPKFFDYYFKIQYWTMAMFAHGKGVSFDNRWTINNDGIKNYEIPFPTKQEQDIIVDKISDSVNKADVLISNQEQQIEKLKAYKQSLITEVVTKGLNPNVPMKDSGVKWLGKIPNNWQTKKVKYVAKIIDDKYLKGEYNYIALENIESHSARFIKTDSVYDLVGTKMAYSDTVIFGKLRPYLAKVFLVKEITCVNNEFSVFKGLEVTNEYLKYFMLGSRFIDTVNASTYGTKMPRANIGFISNLQITIPPFQEQQNIANYLDDKCAKIDALIEIKQKKIDKLNEYKKSLIYEYVTGKKEA